jgi:hypothetical protein
VNEGAVAVGKRAEPRDSGFGIENLIERAAAMQNLAERFGGGTTGSKTRGVGSGRRRLIAHAGRSAMPLVFDALKPFIAVSAAYRRFAKRWIRAKFPQEKPGGLPSGRLDVPAPGMLEITT